MANEGHILIKKSAEEKRSVGRFGMNQFFRPVDKGSAKPAFCYPRRTEHLKEELHRMERVLEEGKIDPERRMGYELKAKKVRERVGLIDESFENAKAIIDKDPDVWKTRRDNLATEIAERTPTREAVRNRTVNPHAVLRDEKNGTNGTRPLEELKREYTIISRAFQARGDYEEANHSFLKKDK